MLFTQPWSRQCAVRSERADNKPHSHDARAGEAEIAAQVVKY
jgi:hypothetical protein